MTREQTSTTPLTGSAQPPLPLWMKGAILYLSIPLLFFLGSWVKLWIAAPVMLCISISIGQMIYRNESGISFKKSIPLTAFIAGISLVFAILTGLVDWVPQSEDYYKHQLILGDLTEQTWPVRYTGENANHFLCYGLGYYMIPAALAKIFGSAQLGAWSFLWAALGLFLAFCGLARHFKRLPLLGITLFLLSAGLGAFWFFAKSGHLQNILGNLKDTWMDANLIDLGLYTSNLDSFTRIFYQPQHGIAGWLGGLVIYELLILRKRWTEAAAVLAATFFWSPLTSLALSVIFAVACLTQYRSFTWRPMIHLFAAAGILCLLAAYYLPHLPIAEKGFIWQFSSDTSWLPWYLLFIIFFAIIPVSSIAWLEWKHPYLGPLKPIVIAMSFVLILSPIYKFGQLGDMRMQLSGPAFLFIAIAIAKGLLEGPAKGRALPYLYLSLVFLAGTLFPIYRTLTNVVSGAKTDYRLSTLREKQLHHITDLRMDGFDAKTQYLGTSEAKTAQWILKAGAKE